MKPCLTFFFISKPNLVAKTVYMEPLSDHISINVELFIPSCEQPLRAKTISSYSRANLDAINQNRPRRTRRLRQELELQISQAIAHQPRCHVHAIVQIFSKLFHLPLYAFTYLSIHHRSTADWNFLLPVSTSSSKRSNISSNAVSCHRSRSVV